MVDVAGKPPLAYYGGKQRMAPKIIPLIPKHAVYVEPFAGGAAVFFKKPWPTVRNKHYYRETLNDTDGNLINFYRVLRDNGQELIEKLCLTMYSAEEHLIAKNLDAGDPVERARKYFINSQQSFSNVIGTGWSTGIFGRNLAATWAKKVSQLPDFLDRMTSVHIENTDAIRCIEKWDSPHTFFYCDPPYPGAEQGHYRGYTGEDFERLCVALGKIRGSFILSNYDSPVPPPDWERFMFFATASSRNRSGYDRSKRKDESAQKRGRIEVVWRKTSTEPVRKEIQKLYNAGDFDCFTGSNYVGDDSAQMRLI